MKKIVLLLSVLIYIGSNSYSQTMVNHLQKLHEPTKILLHKKGTKSQCDTTMTIAFTDDCEYNFTYYIFPNDSGSFVGENAVNYSEVAQRFSGFPAGTISDVYVYFAMKAGTTGNTFLNIYDVNASGKPGILLGTSVIIPKSAIDTFYWNGPANIGALTNYHFSTPVNVANDFFISLSIPTTFSTGTDELGIVTSDVPCGALDDSALCFKKDSTWYSYFQTFGSNLDMAVYPVFCTTPTIAPIANFSANKSYIIPGTIVHFTDQSINIPTNWSWTLTPNTGFNYTGGTNHTSQNPQMIFSNVGTYNVSLTATNSLGSNTCTKQNFIIVINSYPSSWCDTVKPSSFWGSCLDSLTLYPVDCVSPADSGYVTGENIINFSEVGQNYFGIANGTISDVIVQYAKKAGNTGNTCVKIYSMNQTDYGALLGTSGTIVKSAIDTSNAGLNYNNVYHFASPVSIDSNIIVSVSFPATFSYGNDELGIYSENLNCSFGDGYYYYNGMWSNYSSPDFLFCQDYFGLDLAIFPVICAAPAHCYALYNIYPDTATPHHYYMMNLSSGIQPISYYWSWGDGTHDTIAYPNHTYSTAGFYTICLTITDSIGCTSSYCDSSYLQKNTNTIISVTVIPGGTTGINENDLSNQIKIYPNPANYNLTIETPVQSTIQILNIEGQLIKTITSSGNKINIDISALTGGVYIVEVKTEKGVGIKKFVKE